MNDRFVLLKISDEYEEVISDIFKGLCGPRINISKDGSYLVIYHNHENDIDIFNLIKSLESDLDTKILSSNTKSAKFFTTIEVPVSTTNKLA
jgi:hypothetical protein